MRCSSTVSAPVQHCCAPLTAHHSRYIAVQLLTSQVLYFVVETKSRTKDVYTQTCIYLTGQGMLDCELFGLATALDGEYLFVEPESKLSKYAPKNWKSSSSYGLDGHGKPIFILHFRVQYYVDTPLLLRDDITRHSYYLQLRDNALARGHVPFSPPDEVVLLLAGYALQADLGDFADPDTEAEPYFPLDKYFPREMIARNSQLATVAAALHRDNHGLTASEAELQYIKQASSTEMNCGLTHNLHLYKLRSRKKQGDQGHQEQGTVWLGICARGIQVHDESAPARSDQAQTLAWNNIGQLGFDRKKFQIRALSAPPGGKLTYYTSSDEKSKHLLFLCKETHLFSISIQSRLLEARKKEEEERKRYRDCLMYSRHLPTLAKLSIGDGDGSYKARRSDQRVSVISNTSSNTTSGIVSDRVHSLDESEDDLEMEIMINSPPGNSVESLALAHLRDTPAGEEELGEGEDVTDSGREGVEASSSHPAHKSSPSSAAVTPATTDGSQCSSSCSTVVVAGLSVSVTSTASPRRPPPPRRASTTSSLELGYSHTAQNSVVSDCDTEPAKDTVPRAGMSDLETTSSGVYTNSNDLESSRLYEPDLQTNACSSETSGVYVGTSSTSEYGVRERSGSTASAISAVSAVSASGSFHGDGSDPSEAGKGSLLTPEELSDLIVGKNHNSGNYPLRATVSNTLDSDSDYVTLPPPPRPPRVTPIHERPPPPFPEDLHQNYLENRRLKRPSSLQSLLPQQQLLLSQQNVLSQQQQYLARPQYRPSSFSNLPSPSEEATARFVTTKPHISMITHSQVPTFPCSNVSDPGRMSGYPYTTAPPVPQRTYLKPEMADYSVAKRYSIPVDPGAKMKLMQVPVLPIVGKNNYLDVHASRARNLLPVRNVAYHRAFSPLPPPSLHPRQPPPPPPVPSSPLATVYTSQVTRSQIEQFKQQLYSDVDYVIYPMKDPAISKQEYMDVKQGSLLAALAAGGAQYPPPPPYPSAKTHVVYRSAPNVAVASGYLPVNFTNQPVANKYSSNTNLNLSSEHLYGYQTYLPQPSHYSSTSPLYSAASYSSSSCHSLRYEPTQLTDYFVPPHGNSLPGASLSFSRTRSDDNILNPFEYPERGKYRRLPPPPPPPPYEHRQPVASLRIPKEQLSPTSSSPKTNQDDKKIIDIHALIEKSKNLDLPLISALCNDKSLIKQTNAFVMPRHPGVGRSASSHEPKKIAEKERPLSFHAEPKKCEEKKGEEGEGVTGATKTTKTTLLESLFSGKSSKRYASSSKLKYPVSGLSTTQISKPLRKVPSAHVHPKDVQSAGKGSKGGSAMKQKDKAVP